MAAVVTGCTASPHPTAHPSGVSLAHNSSTQQWGIFDGKCSGLRVSLALDGQPVPLDARDIRLHVHVGQHVSMSTSGPCQAGAGFGVHGGALRRISARAAVVARPGTGLVDIEFVQCYAQSCAGGITGLGTATIDAT